MTTNTQERRLPWIVQNLLEIVVILGSIIAVYMSLQTQVTTVEAQTNTNTEDINKLSAQISIIHQINTNIELLKQQANNSAKKEGEMMDIIDRNTEAMRELNTTSRIIAKDLNDLREKVDDEHP